MTLKHLSLDPRGYRNGQPVLFLILDRVRTEIPCLKNWGGCLFKIEVISPNVLWFLSAEMA